MSFGDAVFIEDSAGVIQEANFVAARLLACPREHLVGRNRSDFLTPGSLERLAAQRRLLKPNERVQSDVQFRAGSGKLVNAILEISLISEVAQTGNGKGGTGEFYLVVAREASRRDELERELRLQRQSAGVQHGGLPHAIFFISSRYEISRYPPPGAQGEVRPLDWLFTVIMGPPLSPSLERAWSGQEVALPPAWYSPAKHYDTRKESSIDNARELAAQRWLKITFSPLRLRGPAITDICVHVLDCTAERVEAEDRRLRDHRATVSLLGESLYQELNNYLGVILIQASAFKLTLEQGQQMPANISAIMDAAQQAAGFLRRSADIGDVGGLEEVSSRAAPKELDCNLLLADIGALLAHRYKDSIKVKLELAPDAPRIRGHKDLLQMLLVELAGHMKKTLPPADTLILRSYKAKDVFPGIAVAVGVQLEFPALVPQAMIPSAPYDTEDTLELAFSRSIIRTHHGRLEQIVQSAKGNMLEVALPGLEPIDGGPAPLSAPIDDASATSVSNAAVSSAGIPQVPPRVPGAAVSNAGLPQTVALPAAPCKILLADDEENFRVYTSWILRENGFEVVTAQDGQEAFEQFKEATQSYNLVILDSYMPRMGGLEAYLRMQTLRPDLPVLFASGFARGASAEALVSGCPGPAAVLLKPFGSEDLLTAVNKLLLRTT